MAVDQVGHTVMDCSTFGRHIESVVELETVSIIGDEAQWIVIEGREVVDSSG